MKARTIKLLGVAFLFVCEQPGAFQQIPRPSYEVLGQAPGAPRLEAYLVQGKPCLPLKKFSADAGYRTSVSPSGRNVAVIVGARNAMVLDGKRVVIDSKEIAQSVPPLSRNNDIYLALEFFEQLFPARLRYHAKTRKISVVLSGKTLSIPVYDLPPESSKSKSANPNRKK